MSVTRRVAFSAVFALPFLVTFGPDSGAQAAATTEAIDTVGTTTWTVPDGVTCVSVEVTGAAGGAGGDFGRGGGANPATEDHGGTSFGGPGGLGGQVSAEVVVTPGEALQINVGGAGKPGDTGGSGGVNGGAQGGGGEGAMGGGGGGSSDVRQGGTALADRILVGGGGGGGGAGGPAEATGDPSPRAGGAGSPADTTDDGGVSTALGTPATDPYESTVEGPGLPVEPGGDGGDGAAPNGVDGTDGFSVAGTTGGIAGGGGTPSAGGVAGLNSTNEPGSSEPEAGTFGAGGHGGDSGDGGGGAGGGWYGGGGGGAGYGGTGAGAGGGSSHGPTDAIFANGVESRNGYVVVSYTPGDTSCVAVQDDDAADDDAAGDVIEATPPFTG